MPSSSQKASSELTKLIDQMLAERQTHVDAIERIDREFAAAGIGAPAPAGRPGRKPGKATTKKAKTGKRGGRRKRGVFAQTGEESVLGFVRAHGKPTAGEVNQHWVGEGRGGKADNALGKLVKEGKLKRVKTKGERGSRYAVTAKA